MHTFELSKIFNFTKKKNFSKKVVVGTKEFWPRNALLYLNFYCYRDNVSNFIKWCRYSLQIIECLLFESDDLIMRKNEKHVILCLLEVARRGAK